MSGRRATTNWWPVRHGLRLALDAAALLFCVGHPVWAQGVAPAAVPPGSPVPRVLPQAPPDVALPSPAAPLPAPEGEVPNRPVTITAVAVTGVTAYPLGTITALTGGLIGAGVPLAKVEAARQAILLRYRGDGYLLATVSVHIGADGRLLFDVTEGRIASVKLDGDIGPAGVQVLRFLNRLVTAGPITAARLERYLLLAQDVPGIVLHAVLEPATNEPGALNLVAQVTRRGFSGLTSVDNRAYRLTGPIQGLTVADFNSFTSFGEKTEVTLFHSFPNSQSFGQAASEAFLGGSGLKLRVYGGSGTSDPTGSLGAIGFHSINTVFGAALSYPLIRAREQTLNLSLQFDGLDSTVDTGFGSARARESYDSLRMLRLASDYAVSDLWLGGGFPAIDSASLRLSHGLPILGASTRGDAPPRSGENRNFTKVDGEVTRSQTLLHPWNGASVAVMGLLTGQWSNDVVPPAEQFYLGGATFTRGYYSGQVAGDKALAATVELQLNTGHDLTLFSNNIDIAEQYYLFYDWGQTWQKQSADAHTHLGSAGGGVRASFTPAVEVDLEGLVRLNRYPAGSGPGVAELHGGAFFWRVVARY